MAASKTSLVATTDGGGLCATMWQSPQVPALFSYPSSNSVRWLSLRYPHHPLCLIRFCMTGCPYRGSTGSRADHADAPQGRGTVGRSIRVHVIATAPDKHTVTVVQTVTEYPK